MKEFSDINDIITTLKNTSESKVRRALYEIVSNLYLVSVNSLKDWDKLMVFLLTTSPYKSSQGLEHWFENLYLSDLQSNELDFLLPVIVTEIESFHSHCLWSLAEMLVKHITVQKMELFIGELKIYRSENSQALLKAIECEQNK